jgi:hypothetical protein
MKNNKDEKRTIDSPSLKKRSFNGGINEELKDSSSRIPQSIDSSETIGPEEAAKRDLGVNDKEARRKKEDYEDGNFP